MRVLLAAWLILQLPLWASCAHDTPSFDEVKFRCDDTRGCPDGQKCVDELCASVHVGEVGVLCGGSLCGSAQFCCDNFPNRAVCADLGPSQPTCGRDRRCDGTEDCSTGQSCCVDGNNTSCAASCGDNAQVCSRDAQCPANKSYCCPEPLGMYKRCQSLSC